MRTSLGSAVRLDIIDYSKWQGGTARDEQLLADCHPDEWLLVEVWDES